jgi:hypothetical protein
MVGQTEQIGKQLATGIIEKPKLTFVSIGDTYRRRGQSSKDLVLKDKCAVNIQRLINSPVGNARSFVQYNTTVNRPPLP